MFDNLLKSIKDAFTPAYKSISPTEAKSIIDKGGVTVIDVRTKGEFAQGKIKGAKNIPLQEIMGRIGELEKFKATPILVNCLSGGRSASACGYLAKNGFADVTNLSGGISGWMRAGLKVS